MLFAPQILSHFFQDCLANKTDLLECLHCSDLIIQELCLDFAETSLSRLVKKFTNQQNPNTSPLVFSRYNASNLPNTLHPPGIIRMKRSITNDLAAAFR